jgi:hypothetical protein
MAGNFIQYQNIVGKSNGPSLSEVIKNLKEEIEFIKENGVKSGNIDSVELSTINTEIAALKQLTAPILSIKSDMDSFKSDLTNFKGTLTSLRSSLITLTNSVSQLSTSLNNKIALLQMALLTEKDERISRDQIILEKIDFLFDWFFHGTSDEIMGTI